MENKIKVELLPHTPFLKYNGKFDISTAIEYSSKLAGECYEPEGWSKLKNESIDKSIKRSNFTLALEHATPYEHINIGMEITNIPKIVAMILNNERQCSTSEKSARYTVIDACSDNNISEVEAELYNKWLDKYYELIKREYQDSLSDIKIKKLSQENARYLVSVFGRTKMIHTIPWVQLNRIVSYMKSYCSKNKPSKFERKLINSLKEFIECIEQLDLIDERALSNSKKRSLSLFSKVKVIEQYGDTYSTNYKASFAMLAQAQRHRTIQYSMIMDNDNKFYIPPILNKDKKLLAQWKEDMAKVIDYYPQGLLISINECGAYDKFILKTKERLCTEAQLEIMIQTKETLDKYKESLDKNKHHLAKDISNYTRGARCTFKDYSCARDCKFKDGKTLSRSI